MSLNISNEIIVPTINYIELNYKQKFPTTENVETINGVTITSNGVAKNTIRFKRLEDMIVMCLSTFVHDYVHDYNLGAFHFRVIKENILRTNPDVPSLFENLGIKIGNKTFKMMYYNINNSEIRNLSSYDDSKFEDIPTIPGDKLNFVNYLNSYEEPIVPKGGLRKNSFIPNFKIRQELGKETMNGKDQESEFEEFQPDLPELEDSQLDKKQMDEQKIDEQKIELKSEEFVKPVTFKELEEILIIPSIFGLDFKTIVDKIEKNADFLAFHSSLNTYIVTYLGYEPRDNEEDESDKNMLMNHSIISSFNYIINNFDEAGHEKTLDIYIATFYADIFRILLLSYTAITNKTNKDFKQNVLDILNSPAVLYQFIIYYVTYLSVEDYSGFEKINNYEQKGGEGTPDENDVDSDETNGDSDETNGYSDEEGDGGEEEEGKGDGSALLPVKPKQQIPVPEYVYITHNNLLTTIARGMFIKLGIWKKIFFPDKIPKSDEYVFGFEQMNQITYEKLVELYPIDPELENGNRNNELLILEILILKRLLLEMSPSKTLTFGDKIDDNLKNYMDTFYYDYFIKDSSLSYKPEIKLEHEVELNPDVSENNEKEAEEMFDMCEENCENEFGDDDSIGSNISIGGMKTAVEGIETDELNSNTSATSIVSIQPTVIPIQPEQTIVKRNPPAMPILFNKLKKMYQNNIYTIKQLQQSKIEPIIIEGNTIDNLYDLLKLNETLTHETGKHLNISAPKLKFIINNAANVGANINGSKLFYINKYIVVIKNALDEIDDAVKNNKLSEINSEIETELDKINTKLEETITIRIKELIQKKYNNIMTINELVELEDKTFEKKKIEREEITPLENKLYLIKLINTDPSSFEDFKTNYNRWFKDSQAVFGLYRNLKRGIFCPTSSMMDAMDNCSLKYNATEPKEVGTTYSEIIFEDISTNIKISFGGVVLNYNQIVNDNKELTARLYYELVCNNELNGQDNDTMKLSTLGIKVSESKDLKSTIAYKCVINKIKELYDNPIPNQSISEEVVESGELFYIELPNKKTKKQQKFDTQMQIIKDMWKNLQYQYNPNNFNSLLSSTALKTMGDYLQECQACFKWGGYVSTSEAFPKGLDSNFLDTIKDRLIYRSVSQGGVVVPYDNKGNALRLGIQGDRPSGFRSIYMLLNGTEAVNDQSIAGYMFTSATQNPSRTLLVSRNKNITNNNNLQGNVIFVTRELQTPQKIELLKELEFLNVNDKKRKVEGIEIEPDIIASTIDGLPPLQMVELNKNPNKKIKPLKNSSYVDWTDYETPFVPIQEDVDIDFEETDREREMRLKKEERDKKQTPEAKAEKARIKEEKMEAQAKAKEEKTRLKAEAQAEKTRFKAEEQAKTKAEKEEVRIKAEAEKARIKSEALAEKARVKAETDKIKKTAPKIKASVIEKQKNIKALQLEYYSKIPDGQYIQSDITNNIKKIEILKTEIKDIQATQTSSKNQNIIDSKLTEITNLEEKNRKLNEKFEINASKIAIKGSVGGYNKTKSNKKLYKYKTTKKYSKHKNELTKRRKKVLKIPKNTRKL